MLQRSYFVSSVPVINPDHPAAVSSLYWMLTETEDPILQIQQDKR